MQRREFQFTEGSSNKFWSIELREKGFIVHFGKVGTNGQAQEKTFATEEAANREHDKLIAEKTKKGYVEVQVGNASGLRPAPTKASSEPKPARPAAKAADTSSPSADGAPPAVAAASGGGEPQADGAVRKSSISITEAVISSHLERRVQVTAEGRAMVTWLWQQLPAPPVRSFDYEACIKKARAWCATSYHYVYTHGVELPLRITPEEAWFWIRAWRAGLDSPNRWGVGWQNRQVKSTDEWEEIVRKATQESKLPNRPAEAEEILNLMEVAWNLPQWVSALVPFFEPLDLAQRLMDANLNWIAKTTQSYYQHPSYRMVEAYGNLVVNYMSAEEREKFRAAMSARFHAESDPASHAAQLALGFLSLVRGGTELEGYLASLPTVAGTSNSASLHLSPRLLAGLPDEAAFVSEAERLGVAIPLPNGHNSDRGLEFTRLWLAATEWRHTDAVAKALTQGNNKDDATRMARVLALVEAPEAAPSMLEVQINSKAPAIAAEWFSTHPLNATVGLVPVAMGSGKLAEAASDVLHHFRRSGKEAALHGALLHLPGNAATWLRREVIEVEEESLAEAARSDLPTALAEALAGQRTAKLSAWLQITSLPPIKVSGKKLSLADTGCVLASLKDSALGQAASGASLPSLLKEHADPVSLDSFAWKLFEQWLTLGAPSKDKWAMGAIGHMGGDASVLKLTPMIREWPGESQHQRAVFGLEILRAVGTDTALMSLNGIAQKLKFQGLKEKAKLMMEGIAQARGFTREQLADRIVPDCGLDEHGGRVFDFGPRQFSFVLGPEMKPLVRDAAGKVKSDLPSPNNSDDKEKAEVAVAEWKLLKKTLKEVLKVQADRLEDGMITGRRWTSDEFQQLIVRHPLMVNLARQLVFGCYGEGGALTQSLRITEDQSLADCNDDPCDLPAGSSIGVVHPAHLDEVTKSAWGQILSDYEIIPPFQQLGREICRAEPEDLDKTEITRFRGPKIPGIVVYGILERSHWLRDTPADGGGFVQHSKYFPSSNVTAFIQYTGMGIGYYEEPQEIESVYFVPGHVLPEMWGRHDNRLKIAAVDAVVISEVLRLARAIAAKAA